MITGNAITSIVNRTVDGSGAVDVWVRLTQEAIPSSADEADLNDLYQMLAAARSGRSAYEYVYESCPYAKIVDGIVRVTLPFFVWPSRQDLAYELTTTLGTITAGVAHQTERSFNVVVDHRAAVDLEAIFDGELVPQMPFFRDDGTAVDNPEITVSGSLVVMPEPLTTVLRAEGKIIGFRHELVFEVVKVAADPEQEETGADGEEVGRITYETKDPQAAITVAWTDENGEIQTDVLDMQIPGCVIDLLAACPDGDLKGDPRRPDGVMFVVYYSDCNGTKLSADWEGQQ